MIHIVLWKWREVPARVEYEARHVNIVCAMLRRNITLPDVRIICVTDDPEGIEGCETFPLWDDCADLRNATGEALPSCYRRLRLYDRETQKAMGIAEGDRILGLDLDVLIMGRMDALLLTEGRYVGWQLTGRNYPKVFNGSFQMFDAGDLQDIWSEFDPLHSPRQAFDAGYMGSDQAWLSYRLVKREGSVGLHWPQIMSYPLQTRIQGHPGTKTRIVFFHGTIKPWHPQARIDSPFVDRYWRL